MPRSERPRSRACTITPDDRCECRGIKCRASPTGDETNRPEDLCRSPREGRHLDPVRRVSEMRNRSLCPYDWERAAARGRALLPRHGTTLRPADRSHDGNAPSTLFVLSFDERQERRCANSRGIRRRWRGPNHRNPRKAGV
jgi:hypothetical protein